MILVDDLKRDLYYKDLDVGSIDEKELRHLFHLFDQRLSDQIRSGNFFFEVVRLLGLQKRYLGESIPPALFILLKEELLTEGSRIHEMIVRQGYRIGDEGDGSAYIKRNR